ncbi:MAG: type II secretion system protein [Planctomycetes bacterium]|nr:type II secretion system protein [Planctomycetota bacterium]
MANPQSKILALGQSVALVRPARRRPLLFQRAARALPESAKRHGAFTLTELIVAVAIMGLMVVTAGKVFTLTLGSTGKAQALTHAAQALRVLEGSLRTELAAVDPKGSMLLIEAHSINAHWMATGLEADLDGDPSTGYPHLPDPEREDSNGDLIPPRADVLMFFTAASETAYAGLPEVGTTQVVTYGHAEMGEINPQSAGGAWLTGPVPFPTDPVTIFSVPAQTWHLARRSVLLVPTVPSDINLGGNGFGNRLDDSSVDPNDPSSFPRFAIRDGQRDIVGSASAYLFSQNYTSYPGPADWVLDPSWHARSRMDATPPAVFANRLGHYFLPGCASFKVEWTIDDPRLVGERNVYWFDSGYRKDPSDPNDVEDKLGELLNVINDPMTDPNQALRLQALRKELVPRFGGTPFDVLDTSLFPMPIAGRPVWLDVDPTTVNAANPTGGAADPFFPTALRITVDLVDSKSRFDRPLRHVMILPVGQN